WSSDRAKECASAIEQALNEPVEFAESLHKGAERIRSAEYSAVVIDHWLREAEPESTEALLDHLGPAVAVFVNFAISGAEGVIRELKAAISRRQREMTMARHAARRALRNELKDDVTALLLCCGVASAEAGLSDTLGTRVLQLQQLAEQIRSKLAVTEPADSSAKRS